MTGIATAARGVCGTLSRRQFVAASASVAAIAIAPNCWGIPRTNEPARISCGEPFLSAELLRFGQSNGRGLFPNFDPVSPPARKIVEVGPHRIADMRERGVGFQMLAHVAIPLTAFDQATSVSLSRAINDEAMVGCAGHEARLAPLATLSMLRPDAAAYELERCVHKYGMRGGVLAIPEVDSDDAIARCHPVLEAANALAVPLYVQSSAGSSGLTHLLFGSTSNGSVKILDQWRLSLMLISRGGARSLPRLQILLDRIDARMRHMILNENASREGLSRSIWFTTAGLNYDTELPRLMMAAGQDRFVYGEDLPFTFNAAVADKSMRLRGVGSDAVFRQNPRQLFGLARVSSA